MGGLGNQLFQYAAGFALAKINNDVCKIDLSGFQRQTGGQGAVRFPDILALSISAPIAGHEESEMLRNPYGIVSLGARFVRQRICKRYYSDWHPEVLSLTGDVYLEGYFQCESYFSNCVGSLIQEFQLSPSMELQMVPLAQQMAGLRNPVSLHVRRGDYVSDANIRALHNICTLDYYKKAVAEMRRRVGVCDLVVFSDDIRWVRENLGLEGEVLYLSEGLTSSGAPLTAPQEIAMMSRCRHHIIANSTFSWWGAYLNRQSDKIVIAPNIWSRSRIHPHRNILPRQWLKLPVEV